MCLVNIPGTRLVTSEKLGLQTEVRTYAILTAVRIHSEITPVLSVIVAEEQTSIAGRKDHLQGEPTRESCCHYPEHLGGAEGEKQEGSTVSAGCASVEIPEENPLS